MNSFLKNTLERKRKSVNQVKNRNNGTLDDLDVDVIVEKEEKWERGGLKALKDDNISVCVFYILYIFLYFKIKYKMLMI